MFRVSKSQYELHPAGHYEAMLSGVVEDLEGMYGPQFKFEFETEEERSDGQKATILYYTSQSLSPNSKLGKLVSTLTGRHFNDIDDEIELDTLIGEKCGIVVEHQTKADGGEYAKITALTPAKERIEKKRRPPQAGPPPSDAGLTEDIPF